MSQLPIHVGVGRKSPTSALAIPGKAKLNINNLYHSIVVQHGATGQAVFFTTPEGGDIFKMKGASITASTADHHQKHSLHSTNMVQSGQLGNEIGDVTIQKLGAYYEQAGHDASGAFLSYGLTPSDINQILAKCSIIVKVQGTEFTKGPIRQYGQLTGLMSSLTTTETGTTLGFASAGPIGMGRSLAIPIQATQTDTLRVEFQVANGSSLTFFTTTGEGQPGLLAIEAQVITSSEVRG